MKGPFLRNPPGERQGGTSGSIVCRFVRRIFYTNFYETFSASYFARARCRNARRTAVPEVFEKIGRFGTADPKGAPVAESVAFVNAGDEPLVVLKVAKSCECVQAKFSKRPVMPGDTAVLIVTFNPRGQQSATT